MEVCQSACRRFELICGILAEAAHSPRFFKHTNQQRFNEQIVWAPPSSLQEVVEVLPGAPACSPGWRGRGSARPCTSSSPSLPPGPPPPASLHQSAAARSDREGRWTMMRWSLHQAWYDMFVVWQVEGTLTSDCEYRWKHESFLGLKIKHHRCPRWLAPVVLISPPPLCKQTGLKD